MKLILAVDPTGGLGNQNKLPWDHITGDLKRFKTLTANSTVIMGRNTWESLPIKPLPNRKNIVITSETSLPGIGYEIINDINKIKDDGNMWLIGGSKLINSTWHLITEIHLTRTYSKYTCDTFVNLNKIEENFVSISRELFSDHIYEILKKQRKQ